jgi:hypothetical protein
MERHCFGLVSSCKRRGLPVLQWISLLAQPTLRLVAH